jgi:hypothetical protein
VLVIGATGMVGQPVARTGLFVYDEGNTVNAGINVDYQRAGVSPRTQAGPHHRRTGSKEYIRAST